MIDSFKIHTHREQQTRLRRPKPARICVRHAAYSQLSRLIGQLWLPRRERRTENDKFESAKDDTAGQSRSNQVPRKLKTSEIGRLAPRRSHIYLRSDNCNHGRANSPALTCCCFPLGYLIRLDQQKHQPQPKSGIFGVDIAGG